MRQPSKFALRTDEQLKLASENRLHCSPFVDTDQITVTGQDGIATLTGVVDIWQERDFLIDQALKGGAKSVSSRLTVEYGTDAA